MEVQDLLMVTKEGMPNSGVQSVHTAEDHASALSELESLWDKAELGTTEGNRLSILLDIVESYEREHFPVPPPDPADAIRFRLEQEGLIIHGDDH